MKYISAVIQPYKLQDVRNALSSEEILSMTVSSVMGCGSTESYIETYRGVKREVNLLKQIKIEIAVNDDYLERAIDAIISGARTGEDNDGKIFVVNLEQCVRISTLERGPKAI